MDHEELFILDFIDRDIDQIADSIDQYVFDDVDIYNCDAITEEDLKTYQGYYFE